MTHPERIALVYPYFRTGAGNELLFPPLGIAMLAAGLKKAGLRPRQFDCTFERFDTVVAAIARFNPAVIGISCLASLSRHALDLTAALRERLPRALFAAGGPLPTLFPDRFIPAFDVVFRGEANLAFPAFCRAFARTGKNPLTAPGSGNVRFPGLYASVGGRIVSVPAVHYPAGVIDSFPLADRAGADCARYQRFWRAKRGYRPATILLTYGCPFACDFCSKPVFGNRVRRRNLESVLVEIREIERLGFDALWIADDCLTLDYDYLAAFCDLLLTHGVSLRWSCLSRVDKVTPEIAALMRRAGCFKVYCGLESGSDRTLRLMNKRATVAQGALAVEIFHAAGIQVAAFFIVGYPGETPADVEATFSLALSLPLDEISFSVPYPLPGSALYSRTIPSLDHDDWERENHVRFLYESEFDPARLERRINETLTLFKAGNAGRKKGTVPAWGIRTPPSTEYGTCL